MSLRTASWTFAALIVAVIALTIVDAVIAGFHAQLPGPMARHRDAMAIAISYVRYGHWDGYTSLHAVNRALLEGGLSLRPQDWANAGAKDYFDVMRRPDLVGAALVRAESLPNPRTEGLFFMQDEKGMALLYILGFELFGVSAAGLFYGYMVLVAASLALATITFWRVPGAMFLFLAWACVHHAMMLVLGSQYGVDVNLIQGSRFTGVLAIVPTLHLMLLILLRIRATTAVVIGATLQSALLMFLCNTRMTTLWQLIAILALAAMLALAGVWEQRNRHTRWKIPVARDFWPVAVVIPALIVLVFYQETAYHPQFAVIQQEHPIWHNVITALHNNPARNRAPHSIPNGIPVWDDQVSYILFEREIKTRGELISDYLRADGEWYYRTSDPKWDFVWGKYDLVLRDLFWRTIRESPGYALQSLLWYQPKAALETLFSDRFIKPESLFNARGLTPLFLGVAILVSGALAVPSGSVTALVVLTVFSFVPVTLAAISELRLAESFAAILLLAAVVAGIGLAKLPPLRTVTKTPR